MNRTFLTDYALDLSKKALTETDALDAKAINQSIENIIMTDFGERVFEPKFGINLSTVVFNRLDSRSGEVLLDNIISQIINFEPRITILSNSCSLNISKQTNSIRLQIIYIINKTNTPAEFNKKIVF